MNYSFFAFAISFAFACAELLGQPTPATQVPPGAIVGLPTTPEPPNQQGPAFPNAAMQARFDTVKAYMQLPSPLKMGDQYCAGLGDEAAFLIYTLMVYSPPMSSMQTLTALDIIHKSFARLSAVQKGDRKPEATLALLKLFQATAIDQTVKERIAMETNFLNTLPATIDSAPIGVAGQPPPAGPVGLF